MSLPIWLIAAAIAYFLYQNKKRIYNALSEDSSYDTGKFKIFRESAERLIKIRMSYYQLLDEEEKLMFLSRTFQLEESLAFVSREEGFEVTDEMKVLISAALSQLTFGWKEIKPEHLQQIDLVSDYFYSRLVGDNVQGLTLPGRVMLSWRYFQEGYKMDNDKINLGLHELAHAVWDEANWNDHIKEGLQPWVESATIEFQKMQRHIDSGFFRDYAASNLTEFWACSVECFFEAPVEFQQKLPELYGVMASIMNQDMAGRVQSRPTADLMPT